MRRRPANLHILVAADNGVCRSQARFEQISNREVAVIACIGTTRYVDRIVSRSEARRMWADFVTNGWTRPRQTPVLTVRALRREIYD